MIRRNLHNGILSGAVIRLLGIPVQVYLIFVLMLLSPSCTKMEDSADEWEQQMPVPVSIGLDYPVLSTKGQAIDDLTFLSTHKFGIISLGDANGEFPVFLRKSALAGEDGKVNLLDGNGRPEVVYYPVHSANNYAFYGYYVGDDLDYSKVEPMGGEYGVKIQDYGKVDVLYAKAKAEPLYPEGSLTPVMGFNTEYFRTLKRMQIDESSYLPRLNLQHLCAMINFVMRYEDESLNPESLVYVSRISAMNINYSAALIFRSGQVRTMTKGQVYYQTSRWVNGFGTEFSDANFFLNPDDLDGLYFDISVNYSRDVSPLHAVITNEQIRQVLVDSGVDRFKAGLRYTFDVVLRKSGYAYSTEISAHKE